MNATPKYLVNKKAADISGPRLHIILSDGSEQFIPVEDAVLGRSIHEYLITLERPSAAMMIKTLNKHNDVKLLLENDLPDITPSKLDAGSRIIHSVTDEYVAYQIRTIY